VVILECAFVNYNPGLAHFESCAVTTLVSPEPVKPCWYLLPSLLVVLKLLAWGKLVSWESMIGELLSSSSFESVIKLDSRSCNGDGETPRFKTS
jgi:hypothetical protein